MAERAVARGPGRVSDKAYRWRGKDHEYVKLSGYDGARCILRYGRFRDEWEIQMMDLPHPLLRVRKVSVVDGRNEAMARKADRTEIITPEKIGDRIGRNR